MHFTVSSLVWLSPEVLERIAVLLDIQDLCSLRLVSRAILAKCSNGVFKKCFVTKTVDWTDLKNLRDFENITRTKSLGCLLQDLILVGMPSTVAPDATSHNLLARAFTNLRLNSAYAGLKSLCLRVEGRGGDHEVVPSEMVACIHPDPWREVWATAADTFNITMRAIAESTLPVDELDVFGSINRCSLTCKQVWSILEALDLRHQLDSLRLSFRNLTCMSLSVSMHIKDDPPSEKVESAAEGKRCASSIARLLELCPNLETIKLHWYSLSTINLSEAQIEERKFLTHVADLKSLSRVRDCRLMGIHTDEATLLRFFGMMEQLQHIDMNEIHLKSGTFRPVFDSLTCAVNGSTQIHLNDLWESRLIYFDKPGKPRFPSTNPFDGSTNLTRTGQERVRAIRYHLSTGRARGTPALTGWLRRKRIQYGPPRGNFQGI